MEFLPGCFSSLSPGGSPHQMTNQCKGQWPPPLPQWRTSRSTHPSSAALKQGWLRPPLQLHLGLTSPSPNTASLTGAVRGHPRPTCKLLYQSISQGTQPTMVRNREIFHGKEPHQALRWNKGQRVNGRINIMQSMTNLPCPCRPGEAGLMGWRTLAGPGQVSS